eukprot:scaffold46711_cov36-Phaeocystis_antarctica.AAC.1
MQRAAPAASEAASGRRARALKLGNCILGRLQLDARQGPAAHGTAATALANFARGHRRINDGFEPTVLRGRGHTIRQEHTDVDLPRDVMRAAVERALRHPSPRQRPPGETAWRPPRHPLPLPQCARKALTAAARQHDALEHVGWREGALASVGRRALTLQLQQRRFRRGHRLARLSQQVDHVHDVPSLALKRKLGFVRDARASLALKEEPRARHRVVVQPKGARLPLARRCLPAGPALDPRCDPRVEDDEGVGGDGSIAAIPRGVSTYGSGSLRDEGGHPLRTLTTAGEGEGNRNVQVALQCGGTSTGREAKQRRGQGR